MLNIFKSKKLKDFVRFYFPVLIWMGIIFYLSSIPSLKSGASVIFVEIILRKIAHLMEYAILAFLIFRIFFINKQCLFLKSLLISLLIIFLYSVGDEVHQLFVEDRAGKIIDVGIDLIGGIIGLLIAKLIIYRNFSRKNHISSLNK